MRDKAWIFFALRYANLEAGISRTDRELELGGTRELELGANIVNLFNFSDHWQYNYSGANQSWNSNYLQLPNLQAPLGLQLTFVFRY